MNTILTDDEIKAECRNGYGIDPMLGGNLMEFCRAIEAAVLAKLARPEPVAWMCSDPGLSLKGYSRFSPSCEGAWNIPVYTHPAPQQADRQRVPGLPSEDKARLAYWGSYPDGSSDKCDIWMAAYRWCRAMLAAAPEAPAQADHFEQHLDMVPAQAPSLTLNNDQMGALLVQKFVTEAPAQEGGST